MQRCSGLHIEFFTVNEITLDALRGASQYRVGDGHTRKK